MSISLIVGMIFSPLPDMAPFYKELCAELGWELDSKLVETLEATNKSELDKLEAAIKGSVWSSWGENVMSWLKRADSLMPL